MENSQHLQHEAVACPRCGQQFQCMPGNISSCQCYGLQVSDEVKEYVGGRYSECLCKACLVELSAPGKLFKEKFRKHQ